MATGDETMTFIDVVEAAYEGHGSDRKWMRGVVDAARPQLDVGLGISGYAFEFPRDKPPRFGSVVFAGVSPELQRALDELQRLSKQTFTNLYRVGSVVGSVSQLLGDAFANDPGFAAHLRPRGVHDAVGVAVRDASGCGLSVCAPSPRRLRMSPRDRQHWIRTAAHLAAGHRLLVSEGAPSLDAAAAILSPAGKVLHAHGDTEALSARLALRDAAVRIDRARTRRVRADPDEALTLWQGLVAGRWSLVDHFDRDGRRFVVARENAPDVGARPSLTERECQAIAYAALGHSNKMIAYHLGISATSVASRLASACRKLRVATRARLIELWHATQGPTAS